TLLVQRTGDSSLPFSVDFATADGLAQAGQDYVAQAGTLHFAALQTTNVLSIPILNNARLDGNRDFKVVLSHPPEGSVLQYTDQISVLIINNDNGIQFSRDTFVANEAAGVAEIEVVRSGDQLAAAAVDFMTSDGTARAGADYIAHRT